MTVPQFALLTAAALAGAGTALAAIPPSDAAHYDAAYTVFAYGDEPLSAGPNAFSSGRTREHSGSARSADGRLTIGWGHASAGEGQAAAIANNVSVLDGTIRAAAVTARCRNGAATSAVVGGAVAALNGKASIAYDVRRKNQDGSTTVVGMQIRVNTGDGTVINIASATCAPTPDRPIPPRTAPGPAEPGPHFAAISVEPSSARSVSASVVGETRAVPVIG